MSRPLLKIARQVHLYFGVFITPALLFFALTGAIQSFGLHETNRDHPNYKPAHWIAVLAQIHKKQVATVPVRRPQPPAEATTQTPPTSDIHPHQKHDEAAPLSATAVTAPQAPSAPPPAGRKHNPVPLRVFFLVVCLGLFTSTLTGIYMAYKYNRSRSLVTAALVAGIVLPLLLLIP